MTCLRQNESAQDGKIWGCSVSGTPRLLWVLIPGLPTGSQRGKLPDTLQSWQREGERHFLEMISECSPK